MLLSAERAVGKPSKPSGLTVVIREKKTEAFIDALVE